MGTNLASCIVVVSEISSKNFQVCWQHPLNQSRNKESKQMKTSAPTNDKHSRLQALLYQSPSLASVVALGAGLTASGAANAALIIQDINLTADNNFFDFDLDQDGNDDFRIKDKGSAANIAKKDPIGAVLRKGKFAIKLAAGDEVGEDSGSFKAGTGLFNGSKGFWSESGDHGFWP